MLREATEADLEAPGIARTLRDGIERGYEGELPPAPAEAERYAIEAGGAVVGLFAFVRDTPEAHAIAVHAVAIAPEWRGHAFGARALLAAERRLERDGYHDFYSRVPRGNGRGMYFMLRCGYAPVAPLEDDGATWFRRNLKLAARPRSARPAAEQPTTPPSASG